MSFGKLTSVISVVEDEKPRSVPLLSQPVVNELKYVRLQVLPARDLDVACDFPITLFESGSIARVYPENASAQRLVSDLIGELDSKLRLPSCESAVRPRSTL